MQQSFTTISALLLGLLAGACTSSPADSTAEVSATALYEGQMPSSQAQKALHKLRGVQFVDKNHKLGGGVWTVGGFSIADVDGELLPCIELSQGKDALQLPMLADGDVNYLYEAIYESQGPLESDDVSVQMKQFLRSATRG